MADKLYISKVKLPSGNEYYIKDAEARDLISALGSPTHFAGVSSVPITDGASTPTSIGGKNVGAGDIAVYENAEFIWNGTKWVEFGDLSNLGDLAYLDKVVLSKGSGDNVLGESTTFTNGTSSVTFASGAGSNFVTGVDTAAVAPSLGEASKSAFVTGYNSDGVSASLGAATKSAFVTGYNNDGTEASLGAATTGTFVTGYNNDAVAPSLGNATTGSFVTGYNNDAVAPSLGAATTSAFATNGVLAAMGTGADAETLVFSNASTSDAVTAQGTFSAGSAATLATASAVTAQGTFSAGSPATLATGSAVTAQGTFSAGSLPTLATAQAVTAQGTFNAGSLPTLATANALTAQGTFDPGSAATFTTAKAITPSDTGTAAAQTITVGTNDKVKVAVYDDLNVVVS